MSQRGACGAPYTKLPTGPGCCPVPVSTAGTPGFLADMIGRRLASVGRDLKQEHGLVWVLGGAGSTRREAGGSWAQPWKAAMPLPSNESDHWEVSV